VAAPHPVHATPQGSRCDGPIARCRTAHPIPGPPRPAQRRRLGTASRLPCLYGPRPASPAHRHVPDGPHLPRGRSWSSRSRGTGPRVRAVIRRASDSSRLFDNRELRQLLDHHTCNRRSALGTGNASRSNSPTPMTGSARRDDDGVGRAAQAE
jgi:hypothetical protein